MRPSPLRRLLSLGRAGCSRTCNLSKYRAVHQAGAAGIVEIEDPADQFAGRKQAGDRRAVSVDDARAGVDLQAAESEGEPAGHRIGLERRLIDGVGPIRFRNSKAAGAAAVLDVGIERHLGHHRLVVGP